MAFLVAEHGLQGGQPSVAVTLGLSGCDAQPLVARRHVCLPRSGIELVSPALAGRFFATEPPGKPLI